MLLHRQLSAPHLLTQAGSRGRRELNDELRTKASELEKRFADYKLWIGAGRTAAPPRRSGGGDGNGGEERSVRGERYGAYMERRDARLREGWRTRMEEKEARMKAMWERLERSRAEMAARFAGSTSHNMEKEITEFSAEKKSYDLATPRSTLSRRFSFNSIASYSTTRSSITQVSRPSFFDPSKRMIQPESPLAQSAPAVSDPKKENRISATGDNSSNSISRSRMSARSKSSINNSKRHKPLRSVSSTNRELVNSGLPLSVPDKRKEKVVLNEIQKSGKSKPFLRRGSGIGAGASAGAAISKQRGSTISKTASNEETTEMVDQCDILSDMEKDNDEDCPRLPGNGSDGGNSSLSRESYNDVEPVSENGKANGDKVEELSGESSRSWYSNVDSSFSNKSGVDNLLDSPVGSPPPSISQSVEQLREAESTRARKKWEIADKPTVASNNLQSPKGVTRGLKRFLSFGRESKGSEGSESECTSALVNSHVDEETEREPNMESCPSNDLSKSKDGSFSSGFVDQSNVHTNSQGVHSLHSNIPTSAANFDRREDHSTGKSPKARFFFSFPLFRSMGNEIKLK